MRTFEAQVVEKEARFKKTYILQGALRCPRGNAFDDPRAEAAATAISSIPFPVPPMTPPQNPSQPFMTPPPKPPPGAPPSAPN